VLPLGVGALMFTLAHWPYLFGLINIRMVAIPSSALDYYFEFFSKNPTTHFCQIGLIKAIIGCPYTEQLGVLLQREYNLGNFNGSLFTTEGIASVGPNWAPVATFVCGIVIGLGNVASSRLSPVLVAVSSAILVQSLMNVPLSTVMLSNGGAVLLLLWLISPREITWKAATLSDAERMRWALRNVHWGAPVSAGDVQLDRLLEMNLVEMVDGRPRLTGEGRAEISDQK
jgi:hypothetical protein